MMMILKAHSTNEYSIEGDITTKKHKITNSILSLLIILIQLIPETPLSLYEFK